MEPITPDVEASTGVSLGDGTQTPNLPENEPVSLGSPSGGTVTMPSSELALKRTNKMNYALGDKLQRPPSDIYQNLMSGQENALRDEAAHKQQYQSQMQRQQMLMKASSEGPLTWDQVGNILDPYNTKAPDPTSVMETNFAKKYLGSMTSLAAWSDLQKDNLGAADKAESLGQDVLARLEYIRTVNENLDQQISNQGWIPWLADQAKSLTQLYPELKLRSNDPDVGFLSGGTLGENLKRQGDDIISAPTFEEFKTKFDTAINNLSKDNPTLAKQFAGYVLGNSTSDRILDNLFTVVAPFDVATGVKMGVGAVRGISVERRAAKAVKDMLKSSAVAGDMPIAAAAAEGAGNLPAAGALRGAESAQKQINGTADWMKTIQDKLFSGFRLDAENLWDKPGTQSREQMLRYENSFLAPSQDLQDKLANLQRVNRTPNPLTDPDAFKAYKEVIDEQFRGIDNAVLDYSQPFIEPNSNTRFVKVSIGNLDGSLFSNEDTAKAFADFHGFNDIKIEPAEGAVQTKPERLVGSEYQLKRKRQLEGPDGSIRMYQEGLTDLRRKLRNKSLSKEDRASINESIRDYKTTLTRYQKELETINSKITTAPAVVEQNGLGYKITVTKPFVETHDITRNYLIRNGKGEIIPEAVGSGSATGWDSWKNAALGWFRGADDTLAVNEAIQRKTAVYAQNVLKDWAKQEAQRISDLAQGVTRVDPVTGVAKPWYSRVAQTFYNNATLKQRTVFRQFQETLDYARKAIDPVTKETGYFFKTPGEIEDHYNRFYQRPPTVQEIEAYFSHVKLTEFDRVLREIAEFRNRARIGAEQWQFSMMDRKTQTKSGFFDGVRQTVFPGGDGQILVLGKNKGEEKLYTLGSNKINPKTLEDFREGVKEGRYTVVQLYRPDDYPLSKFSNVAGANRVRYILAPAAESKPLDFNHIPRRGGGHFEYDYNHYIKQAKIHADELGDVASDKRTIYNKYYLGDTTVMPILNRIMGRDVVGKMNAVRELMLAGKNDEAKALLQKTLPIEWDEWHGWFNPKRAADGVVYPARLSLDEPFYVVPKNKKIYDIDKALEDRINKTGTFKDASKSGSLAAQYQVAYTQARDADRMNTIVNKGTHANPLYGYEPAQMVSPIPTMNRALSRAINSTFMDDYKFMAVEHWLEEARPFLKADVDEIRNSPFYFFETAVDKAAFKSGTDWDRMRNLLSNHAKIKQFLGIPNTFDTWVHGVTQHLVDSQYEKGGLAGKAMIVPIWALQHIKDPVQFIRSVTFNAKLGLFAVPQLIVQAQTYASIIALEPTRGLNSIYASTLHQYARLNSNPEILAHLDDLATKLNIGGAKWKPGEWKEAREELAKTGFEHVAGEHQFTDNQLDFKPIQNTWGNFLNSGQIFFREGEKFTRLGAWYTAFKKFRDENPIGAISQADRAKILQYADLLSNNMSRASASNLHSGVFSLTSQFLSYQLRLAELFLGKRLGETTAARNWNRAKMFAVYSTLYGVPAATGLIGYPLGDSIRQEAIDRGYVVGENWLKSLLMEGLPAMSLAWATGQHYNVGDRYGSQGLTFVKEALRSDGTWYKLLGGAGVSTFANILSNSDGLYSSIAPWMRASNAELQQHGLDHTFQVQDLLDPFKEISSVNQTWKALYAMNTGRWMSKNEGYIKNVGPLNAIFMAATGLSPQEQDDMYIKTSIMKDEKNYQAYMQKEFQKEYQRGIQASVDGNQAQATDFMRRAFWRLEAAGFSPDQKATILERASKGYESQLDSISFNFATRNVPNFKRGMLGIDANLPFLGQNNVQDTRLQQLQAEQGNK